MRKGWGKITMRTLSSEHRVHHPSGGFLLPSIRALHAGCQKINCFPARSGFLNGQLTLLLLFFLFDLRLFLLLSLFFILLAAFFSHYVSPFDNIRIWPGTDKQPSRHRTVTIISSLHAVELIKKYFSDARWNTAA
jgi:hypothetical protein